jgi:hypothetical protein
MRTSEGYLFSIPTLLTIVMHSLFRLGRFTDLPPAEACIALLIISAGCLFLLGRKIRAYEVVR